MIIYNINNEILNEEEIDYTKGYLEPISENSARFIPYTQKQLKTMQYEPKIGTLKYFLKQSDYQAIKYAEGLITEQEYAEIKAQRQAWRDEINRLEQEIKNA